MAITTLKTISQLPEISAISDNSFFVASVPSEYNAESQTAIYSSKKISKRALGTSIVKQVSNYYELNNGFSSDVNVGDLWNDFYRLSGGPQFSITNPKLTFANSAPKISETLTDFFNVDDQKKAVNLETLKSYSGKAASPAIGPNFGFVTSLSSNVPDSQAFYNLYKIDKVGDSYVTNGSFNWGLLPDIKYTSSNQFLFQIKPGTKESNVWKAPASGIFTCYGWMDEIQTEKMSNESRWVALMGRKEFSDGESKWLILQLQPFISNNYLSYVGFTFPVQAGMLLKLQTGFTVGNNSGLYSSLQSSLANGIANAFFGGIYTNLSIAIGEDVEYSNVNSSILNDLSTRISALEISANSNLTTDNFQQEQIDELSNRNFCSCDISAISSTLSALSVEISSCVKYINPNSYTSAPISASLYLYDIMANIGVNSKEDPNYKQDCLYNGVVSSGVPLLYYSLDEILTKRYRTYYAPPSHQEIYDEQHGIVEKAYRTSETPIYGRVFSDGKLLFYCVSQDCTVVINMTGDFTPYIGSRDLCWLLLPNTRHAIKLLDALEIIGDGVDPTVSIAVPVKKGTIIFFTPWHSTPIPSNSPINAQSFYVRKMWWSLFANCDMPFYSAIYSIDEIESSLSVRGGFSNSDRTETPIYNYAIWTTDQTQRNHLVGTNPDLQLGNNLFNNGVAKIATIVELP